MRPTFGDTATRVLLAVLSQPRPTVPAVALAAGCSRGHAHALLVELRDAGLVTWERGRSGTLRPACRVVAVEPQFGPVGYDDEGRPEDLDELGAAHRHRPVKEVSTRAAR